MLGEQQRLRARHMVEHLFRLDEEGEEPLHHHASGSWQPLDMPLKVSHLRAKAASHLADTVAKNWPPKVRRWLHSQAAEEHKKTAHEVNNAGFHHLAQQHAQWAHYHASHAAQEPEQQPRLVQHPVTGGHARSGHTLPQQPPTVQVPGDSPAAAASHQKASKTGGHWNARSGGYEKIPKSVRQMTKRANVVSKSVNRISLDPNFSDQERAHHHRVAAGHHTAVAQELMRHGFEQQAEKHVKLAQKHTVKAGDHDAVARGQK